MPADLLIVTPSSNLGENVRKALDETKLYRIHVVNNKASAVVRADEVGAPLAMLDYALGEEWVNEIGMALRTVRPGINLVILFEEKVTPPVFDGLRPWILVRKPFRMSEFMTAISQPQSVPVKKPGSTPNQPWLSDPTRAAQHLTRLTLESSAQAALITFNNDLWAYAGGLSQNAAQEVSQTVTRNWDGQKGSDLLRFIRLESTKAEHMLYATRLTNETVLAFVFEAETPFSTIRAQASELVNNFGAETGSQQPSNARQDEAIETKSDMDDGDDMDVAPISNILKNIPTPNPQPPSTHDFRSPNKRERIDPNQTRISTALSDASVFSREGSPSAPLNSLVEQRQQPNLKADMDVSFDEEVQVTAPSKPKQRPKTPSAVPQYNESDVTRESPTTEAVRKLVIESTTAGLYHLTYACLLIPRFGPHFLTGDLADYLDEWLPNICIAFGWRLEYLSIRPEYLQWVVNVQPNTSPGYLMRIMRQQTSEKIFSEFIRLKKENPSGDFWAPGYLIMGGTQPHPPQLVKDYIKQTRGRQGQDSTPLPPRN